MVMNNIDPMQLGRLQVQVPDVSGLLPGELGDAVRADRRHPDRHVRAAADRLRRVGRVRAGRPRLPDLGRLLLGQRRRGAGARARDAAGGCRDHAANAAAERTDDQRPARARPAESC